MESGHANAGASGQRHNKVHAFRKLFQKSLFNRSMTSRGGATSSLLASGSGNSLGAAQDPVVLDDHMQNSIYFGTDTCMDCGFTRGSSVFCPVTHRHHGTNELTVSDSNQTSHSPFSSASKRSATKEWGGLPTPHARRAVDSQRGSNGDIAPTAAALHPAVQSVEDATATGTGTNGGSYEADTSPIGEAGDNENLESGTRGQENGDCVHQHSKINAHEDNASVEAANQEGGGMQYYYYYTDENGSTYWYVQEPQDSMQQQQPAADAEAVNASSQATTYCYESQTGQYWIDTSTLAGSYMCEYVDENGHTGYYLYTPEVDGAQDSTTATPQQMQDTNSDGTTSTRAIVATGPDAISQESGNAAPLPKRKTPGALFAAIKGVLRPHRSPHAPGANENRVAHDLDPDPSLFVTDSDIEPLAPLRTALSETLTSPCNSEVSLSDNEAEELIKELDAAGRKQSISELKRHVKELAVTEKKERVIIMKERRNDIATLEREKRAEALVLRNSESSITKKPKDL
ncbi:hypothetical protein, unknown function [Leishmania tarentolae]|uniref:Uncharacterized protein n=1 Tax=Leishmania tarentolae TaxID=5689 RepID=A0A640KYM8_LEITA|nr:hypothetical protein, unknown function [Leishmania tarentolae]